LQLAHKNVRNLQVIDGGRATPLEAARQWEEKGYYVVPIPFREKKPAIAGWPALRLKAEDLPHHFGSVAQNVGLLLGEPYGITDIDLDAPEAVQLWQIFAPPTKCGFGHQSKPFSHSLYHMDPPGPSLKFTDPIDKTTLLELRCLSSDGKVGRQTVIPPSTHKDSGEAICFTRGLDGDPVNVEAEVLIRAVRRCAAACVLARHYPPSGGGRHDCELALSGILARADWPEEDAKQFVLAVYGAVRDHDRSAFGRVSQGVEDSYRRLREGGDVTGIPKLMTLMNKKAVDAALEWLGIGTGAGGVVDINASNWRESLIRDDRGHIIPHVSNALISLHAKEWEGVLRFNQSALRVEAHTNPPWQFRKPLPFTWMDEDDVRAATWMAQQGIAASTSTAGKAIQAFAREHGYHPIRQFFESLKWDGIARLDSWTLLYLGCDKSDYNTAVGSKWMISAVARTYCPGAKVDCALVLEGEQGARKSTALRVLAEPFFTDEIADLGSKDSSMQVHGVLVVEIAELDAMQKSEVGKIKAFLSRSEDRFRPPYGHHVIAAPRESVFAGSVNDSEYLKDPTGGRRFWPIKCGRIDIETLKRDRGQLWAEAVVRYKAGENWWLEGDLIRIAEEEQAQRYDTDPWLPLIEDYIKGLDSVSIQEILERCLTMPKDRWHRPEKNRIGASLRFLGWVMRKVGPKGHQAWRYFPPPES
jgi:hypothetical protein